MGQQGISTVGTKAERVHRTGHPLGAGIVILNDGLEPVYANPVALQVLTFPRFPGEDGLADRILELLCRAEHGAKSLSLTTIVSGRRRYVCRFFALGPPSNGSPQTAIALILERSPKGSLDIARVAAEYHLTERERETMGYLVEGLTSKEIAQRMGISSNTVKVFLRLAMVKLGVTTRSGIVGKLVKRGGATPFGG